MTRPFRTGTYAFLWALAVGLSAIVVALYLLSSHVSELEKIQVELNVREIISLDTRLGLDALRLRHNQLQNYDSLSAATRDIDDRLAQLDAPFQKMGLGDELPPLLAAWDKKKANLDEFKRHNSILTNSFQSFVNLLASLQSYFDHTSPNPIAPTLSRVARDVLVFTNQRDAGNLFALVAGLRQLDNLAASLPTEQQTELRLLVAHGEIIVNNHQLVAVQLDSQAEIPFAELIENAYRKYAEHHNAAVREAEKYRQLMAAFSLLLVITLATILLKLRLASHELLRSHRLLDNIADHLGEGILAFDHGGRLTFLNRRARLMLGGNEDELLGHEAAELLAGEQHGKNGERFLTAQREGEGFADEFEVCRRDGSTFPASFLGGPLPGDEGTGRGYVVSFRDLSEIRLAQARLRLAGRVFDNLREGMTITGPDGRIQSVNEAFCLITGYSEDEAIGHKPGEVLHSGQHDAAFFQDMWQQLHQSGSWQGEIINRRKNGEVYPEWLSITAVRNERNEIANYVGLFSDITDRKQAEAYIHHLAYYDPLTGLANRLLFHDRLDNAMQQAHRASRPMAVLLLDLDRFKEINDSLGHDAGDQLLKLVTARLQECQCEGDTLARLGGDEFGLILPEIRSHADVATLAGRLLSSFDSAFNLGGHELFVSTSIGIAVYPSDGGNPESLLRHADAALYIAKDSGRSSFRFHVESDGPSSLERLELENSLRYAIGRDELRLYYQVQIDSQNGCVAGAEALVRWQHPGRGLLLPEHFIPLAESCGLIDALGKWCLETACRQIVAWQESGIDVPRIAVNVSARQLRDPQFPIHVLELVERYGIAPGSLELELTESMLSEDAERTLAIFSQMRAHGIRIAIDDFGTGYSSLSYLSRYPVDIVKIDRSFVQGLEQDPDARSIAQAIVLLAHGLHMKTVAEGVETSGQEEVLRQLGCDQLQGFLFSRPEPADKIPRLVKAVTLSTSLKAGKV
jgi:diguanylate cyclase (GGDEF)-like protein/PAS domain S-box-containing protein